MELKPISSDNLCHSDTLIGEKPNLDRLKLFRFNLKMNPESVLISNVLCVYTYTNIISNR